MEFAKSSELLMDQFIKDFSKVKIKKNAIQQRRLDNVLKILYREIISAEKYVSLLTAVGELKTELLDKSSDAFPNCSLLDSHFVVSPARSYVEKHLSGYVVYKTKILDREIEIYFGLLTKDDYDNMHKFDKYVRKMLVWLKIASRYSSDRCAKKMKVFCLLTPFKKMLPVNQFKVVSPDHCNSAVTTSCVGEGEILIYREEEMIKVFIHETFHLLGLDFSDLPTTSLNRRLRGLFPIKSEYNVYEAYAEFWASIANAALCSYGLLDDIHDEKQFLLYCDFCIQFEQIFSLFQCVKLLDFMGLRYTNLYSNDCVSRSVRKYLYKEKTNAFAYYVIKANLLYFCDPFMQWCLKNNTSLLSFNKSVSHMDKFYRFIEEHYKRQNFLDDIERMQRFLKTVKAKRAYQNPNTLTKTMRMSVCELTM